jgi:hypothetical protein
VLWYNLSLLKTYVRVSVFKLNSQKYSKEYFSEFRNIIPNYDIIVFTEKHPKNLLIEINDFCRKKR